MVTNSFYEIRISYCLNTRSRFAAINIDSGIFLWWERRTAIPLFDAGDMTKVSTENNRAEINLFYRR
jgi:hypothetical protein